MLGGLLDHQSDDPEPKFDSDSFQKEQDNTCNNRQFSAGVDDWIDRHSWVTM